MTKCKRTVQRTGRHCRLPLAAGLLMMACLAVPLLPGCSQNATKTTGTLQPTVISPVPSSAPTAAPPTKPPTEPTHVLQALSDYGSFASGHSLQLPAGIWLDTAESGLLMQIDGLVVSTTGQGRPTLSQAAEDKPLLILQDCSSITFRQIRFGYDRPDWPDRVAADATTLIHLVNCRDIRFEDCIFFSGSGSALLLQGSENIVLENCTFYNFAGSPLVTDDTGLPSQIRASDTLFETVGSGRMPLHLRDSSFDRCVWVGRRGYQVPDIPEDARLAGPVLPLQDKSLPQLLHGILASRIAHYSDEAKNITVRDNLFASREVFALFDRLEQQLPGLLPDQVISWSLTGQKAEEADFGAPLDPVLGLKMVLRTQIEAAAGPAAGQAQTDEAAGQLETPGREQEPLPGIYDIKRLLADLQGLRQMDGRLDPLLTGQLAVVMSDQHQNPLLSARLPLNALGKWLDPARPDLLLNNGQIVMYNQMIRPADFCLRETAGAFAAAQVRPALQDALHILADPAIVFIDGQARIIESRLLYLGTAIGGLAGMHHFMHQVVWTAGEDRPAGQEQLREIRINLAVNAVSAGKTLIEKNGGHRAFQLADQQQAELIRLLLQAETVTIGQPDGSQLTLGACSAWASGAADCLPLYILGRTDEELDLLTLLYDSQCRPYLVSLVLLEASGRYAIQSASLYAP